MPEGWAVGLLLGCEEGEEEGIELGTIEGIELGREEGMLDG